jgi:hypothetical protein
VVTIIDFDNLNSCRPMKSLAGLHCARTENVFMVAVELDNFNRLQKSSYWKSNYITKRIARQRENIFMGAAEFDNYKRL